MKNLFFATILLLSMLLLVGCGMGEDSVAMADNEVAQFKPVNPTNEPDEATGSTEESEESQESEESEVLSVPWRRDASTIILQYREGGGYRVTPQATELPQWTLYGDGVVIWTDSSTEASPGFAQTVWMGTLSDAEINQLVAFTDDLGFWSLDGNYRPEVTTETSGDTVMVQAPVLDLPSATVIVNLIERTHSVEVYPSTLEGMPESYRSLRDRLLSTHPANATTYTASSFRLEARSLGGLESMPEGNRAVFVEWPFADIALADVTQAPRSVEGSKGLEVARFLIAQGFNVSQDGSGYILSLFASPPRPTTTP